MRMSRQQVAENRERILTMSSHLFRERGIDGVGVSDLMHAAGMTQGAFYGYFDSKQDLVAEMCSVAIEQMKATFSRSAGAAGGDDAATAIVSSYLSSRHRHAVGRGCLFAALGGEIARQSPGVRRSVTDGLRGFLDHLAVLLPGRVKAARRERAIAMFASLVGGMVLARLVDDPALSGEILEAVTRAQA
jgi:TetR/AcrR family transcriptional repressor of nem operon